MDERDADGGFAECGRAGRSFAGFGVLLDLLVQLGHVLQCFLFAFHLDQCRQYGIGCAG